MYVYVLFHETNTGHTDESDGYVEGIYATEELAKAAQLAAYRECIKAGRGVWWNPDEPDEEGPADWEDDFRIEQHSVLAEVPKAVTIYGVEANQ